MAEETAEKRHRVAVVYHFFAHYREPILRLLCQQSSPNPEYVMVSDTKPNITIKTIDPGKAEIPVEKGGLRWQFVRNRWMGGERVLWQTGLIRLALSRKYDTIIFLGMSQFASTWVSAILARLTGKKVLFWTHGFYGNEGWLKMWFRKRFYKLAHCMCLYGNWARKICIEKGFDPEKLYVVFNSLDYDAQVRMHDRIDPDRCRQLREEFFEDPDLPVLFFVGRITPQKHLDMLLRVAGTLTERDRAVNVLLIGSGPERESLQQLSETLSLKGQVHFYGACHDEQELSMLISLSDLCVAPGEVGLTAMHSMVYGTPVVTHNDPTHQMPEFEAVIEGKSGDFYEYGNEDDLADTIERWFAQAGERDQVRRDCQEVIGKYYNPHVQVEIFNAAVRGVPAMRLPLGESKYVVK